MAWHAQNRNALSCVRSRFEDATAHSGADTERIVQGVLADARPNLVLVGGRVVANAPLLECLTTPPGGTGDGVGDGDGAARAATAEEGSAADNDAPATAARPTIPYQLLKSSAFEPRQCRSVILAKLRVLTLMRRAVTRDFAPHATAHASAATPSNFHSLASVIDFDNSTLVRALGSLLTYLVSM